MEVIKCVVCSKRHLTAQDTKRLEWLSNPSMLNHQDWIHDTGYGYLIRLDAYRYPLLALKENDISKNVRKLILNLMRKHEIRMIHFDCGANIIEGAEVFD